MKTDSPVDRAMEEARALASAEAERAEKALRASFGTALEPNANLLPGAEVHTTLRFYDEGNLQQHLAVITAHLQSGSNAVTPELQDAVHYLGLDVFVKTTRDTYTDYDDHTTIFPAKKGVEWSLPNPAVKPDFFDKLRLLDAAIKGLSQSIRSINDRSQVTPEMKAVRAYLDAFRAFLDAEQGEPPDTIPVAIPRGLLQRLRNVDWLTVSEQAHKWAETIRKFIPLL